MPRGRQEGVESQGGHVDQPAVGFEVAKLVKPRVELGQLPCLHTSFLDPRAWEMAGRQDGHEDPQRSEYELTQGARP